MAGSEFSPEIQKALNSYVVPLPPIGFADRVMARIEAGDTATAATATGLPQSFRRKGGGGVWRRSSRIICSVAFLSLATATAAAAGIFGNPVYVPVVSEVLARTELLPSPSAAAPDKPVELAAQAPDAVTGPTLPANGTQAVIDRIQQLRDDPRFGNLLPRQKFVVARRQVRNMVRSGEATPQEARAAVRELVQNADPETRERWREAAIARRQARLRRSGAVATGAPAVTAGEMKTTPVDDELIVTNSDPSSKNVEALPERHDN